MHSQVEEVTQAEWNEVAELIETIVQARILEREQKELKLQGRDYYEAWAKTWE